MAWKVKMYEPYGYREDVGYVSLATKAKEEEEQQKKTDTNQDKKIEEMESASFTDVRYNSSDKNIEFCNEKGEVVDTVKINDIISSSFVERATYDPVTEVLTLYFGKNSKGEDVTVDIDLHDLIDINEFKDGLEIISGDVYVKLDENSDKIIVDSGGTQADVLSLSPDGIKVNNIQRAIDVEKDRAMAIEAYLQEQIDDVSSGSSGATEALKIRIEALEGFQSKVENAIRFDDHGDIYLYVEDDWVNVNDALGPLVHETF